MFDQANDFLLKLEGVTLQSHFEKISYRIGSSIVATFDENSFQFCVKLSLEEQESYSILFPDSVKPVPNKWGAFGWTLVDCEVISIEDIKEILSSAYREVSNKKMKR